MLVSMLSNALKMSNNMLCEDSLYPLIQVSFFTIETIQINSKPVTFIYHPTNIYMPSVKMFKFNKRQGNFFLGVHLLYESIWSSLTHSSILFLCLIMWGGGGVKLSHATQKFVKSTCVLTIITLL